MNSFYYPLLKLNEYDQVRDCLSQKKHVRLQDAVTPSLHIL